MVPRCAIFDCDGILDSETVWNDVQRELFARWSVPFTEEVEHPPHQPGGSRRRAGACPTLLRGAERLGKPDTASAEYAEHHERVMKDLLTTEHEVISSGVDLIEGATVPGLPERKHTAGCGGVELHREHSDPEDGKLGYARWCAPGSAATTFRPVSPPGHVPGGGTSPRL